MIVAILILVTVPQQQLLVIAFGHKIASLSVMRNIVKTILYCGIEGTYESILVWGSEFFGMAANKIRKGRYKLFDKCYLDKVLVVIKGNI